MKTKWAGGRITASLAAAIAMLIIPLAVQAEDTQVSKTMQIAQGAKAWYENCGRCHNIRNPKEFADYEWEVIATHMRVRANLPGQVARDIKAFLKATN